MCHAHQKVLETQQRTGVVQDLTFWLRGQVTNKETHRRQLNLVINVTWKRRDRDGASVLERERGR